MTHSQLSGEGWGSHSVFTSIHSQRLSELLLCALAVLGTVQGIPVCGTWCLPGPGFSLEGTKAEQDRLERT